MMGNTASQIRSLGGEAETAGQDTEVLAKRLEHAGSPQIARNITTNASSIRNTGRAARDTEAPLRRVGDGLRRVGDESDRSGSALRRFAGNAMGLRQVMMLMLVPAIGLASTGISALGAGVIELLPNLTRLSGLAAPAGVAVMGVGLAAITAKLAFSDLGKAMSGNAKAMKSLTPEAKQFLTTIRQYKPVLQELRQSAQRGLFPGLDSALRQLNKGVPVARSMLNAMGRRLGNLASDAAGQITAPAFLRDFETIGNQAGETLTALGHGVLNLMQAFRHFLVAGLPFTHWLTNTALGWTKHIELMAQAGRESGRLSNWFIHVQQSLTVLGRIAHNVFSFVGGVLKAASGESDYLYGSIERTTGKWAAWAQSAHGQSDMRQYFQSMRQPLSEVVGFVGDLVKGIGSMVDAPTFVNSIATLRQAVPGLAAGLGSIARDFGPVLVGAISQAITLFSTLAGHGGPLSTMLGMLTGVLTTVNSLLKVVPGLGTIMAVAFAVLGTRAMMAKFGLLDGLTGKLGQLAGGWRGVATAASGAAAAEERAAGLALAGGVGPMGVLPMGRQVRGAASYQAAARTEAGAGQLGLGQQMALFGGANAAVSGSRAMLGRSAMAQVEGDSALAARGLGSMGLGGRLASARLTAAAGLAAGRGALPGIARAGLGTAGRFVAPLAAFQFLAGAVGSKGSLSDRIQNGASSATFGLVPRQLGGDELAQKGQNRALQQFGTTMPTNRAALDRMRAAVTGRLRTASANSQTRGGGGLFGGAGFLGIAQPGRMGTAGPTADEAKQNRGAAVVYRAQLKALDQQQEQWHREAVARARVQGQQLAMGYGEAFNIYSRKYGPAKGMKETGDDVIKRMAKLGPVGRMTLATSMTQWAREQARMNPKLSGQAQDLQQKIAATLDRLGQHVKIVNGRILTGSTTQWQNIATAMETPAEKAREAVSTSFTQLQQQAVGALTMMGYTRGQATQLIKGTASGGVSTDSSGNIVRSSTFAKAQMHGFSPTGGKHGARGMRIGGTGLQDNVMVAPGHWAAPGELIVNRHTERRVRQRYGVDLGREVAGETTPHSAPARYARGGRIGAVGAGLHPGIARAVAQVLGHFPGLSITSTTGGGHAKGSYHYLGEAADIGGTPALMNTAASWIGRVMGSNLTEGIHNPNLSIKNGSRVPPGFWGSTVWGEHANHIHLAIAGALGALSGLPGGGGGGRGGGALGRLSLKAPVTGLGGVAGALAQAGMNSITAGMNAKVNQRMGAAGGGGLGGGTSGANQALGRRMMLAHGWGAGQWPSLKALWTRESGWNQNARNPSSGAYGIPQALGHGNVFGSNPAAQIKWGLNYIAGRYGSPAGAWAHEQSAGWYEKGGRMPGWGGWFGQGGRARYRRPTMIGVGDATVPEEVTVRQVRPTAGDNQTGGRVVVNFHPGAIVIQGGASREAAEELADHVISRITKAMSGMSHESEGSVSG